MQVVVLIGSSASAVDVTRDIAKVAKEVHISSRSAPDGPTAKHPGYYNMWLHSMIRSTHEDGTVVFWDGSSVVAEIILHCTGYKYNFPFLKTNDIVTVDDNCVGPLYKHVRFDITEIAKPYAMELLRFREAGFEVIVKDFKEEMGTTIPCIL